MSTPINTIVKPLLLGAIVGLLVGAGLGWVTQGWRKNAELSELRKEQATKDEKAATAANKALQDAITRGDQLTERLTTAEAQLTTITEEKNDAIRRLTTGRACLNSRTVSVLNSSDTSAVSSHDVSQAASSAVSEDARFATDSDVGLWIAAAQRAYNSCRERLNAIADFYAVKQEPN